MWTHEHLPISFNLVVDDLEVKCIGEKIAKHLMDTLHQQYEISADWSETNYLGLDIE